MKKTVIKRLSMIMAIIFILVQLPSLALTRSEVIRTPEGYDEHDYQKILAFFETTDEAGVKNGDKAFSNYDPNDPNTWVSYDSFNHIYWTATDVKKVREFSIYESECVGTIDVSGCDSLTYLDCSFNFITELNVSNTPKLLSLACGENRISELDISTCPELNILICNDNNIAALDVTNNPKVESIKCSNNPISELNLENNASLAVLECTNMELTELDVSNNPDLWFFFCRGNALSELNLESNPWLWSVDCSDNQLSSLKLSDDANIIYLECHNNKLMELDWSNENFDIYLNAEEHGYVGVRREIDAGYDYTYLYAVANAQPGYSFVGWYDRFGARISTNLEFCFGSYNMTYFENFYTTFDDLEFTAIFRRNATSQIGDVDGDGNITVQDAVLAARIALNIIGFTNEQYLCADYDQDGEVRVADAIQIARRALNLN